jgi:DNA-directed RNA polymerase specialized sigma24 family protein
MNDLALKKALFTQVDYSILRSAVKRLPGLLSKVVELRFWNNRSIVEISDELGVSIRHTESALQRASVILKEECLRHPAFSRSKYNAIQGLYARLAA